MRARFACLDVPAFAASGRADFALVFLMEEREEERKFHHSQNFMQKQFVH